MNDEIKMQRRIDQREDRDYRAFVREGRLMEKAEPLVGELMREGRKVFYVNARGGKVREFDQFLPAAMFLIRNRYV